MVVIKLMSNSLLLYLKEVGTGTWLWPLQAISIKFLNLAPSVNLFPNTFLDFCFLAGKRLRTYNIHKTGETKVKETKPGRYKEIINKLI